MRSRRILFLLASCCRASSSNRYPGEAPHLQSFLNVSALREHGADRLNALEVKAAAFICRSALEAHSDVGERVPGGDGGTSHVYPSIGALQLLDQYLELYSALDSFHVYLIEPVWPQSPEWWLGCPSGEGACSPPAWPWRFRRA